MPARIGPRRQKRLFISVWREARGLTQKRLAERLGVSEMTISRWETGQVLLNSDTMAALAEKLDIEPYDLYRHPDQPSADELLRGQPPEVVIQAMSLIKAIRR